MYSSGSKIDGTRQCCSFSYLKSPKFVHTPLNCYVGDRDTYYTIVVLSFKILQLFYLMIADALSFYCSDYFDITDCITKKQR